MSDNFSIPQNLHDLKVALGIAIVAYIYEKAGRTNYNPSGSDEYYIEAAEAWIGQNQRGLKAIALLAGRAITHGDVRMSLMSDLRNDLGGATTFLRTCQPAYFARLFYTGTRQRGEPLESFLLLLSQLPPN